MKNYEDLVANVRGLSQEAEKERFDWQGWFQTASWEDMSVYWEQQHQDQELDYMGRPKGGKGDKGFRKGAPTRGADWVETRKCHWCDLPGHLVPDCPAKKAGKAQKPGLARKGGGSEGG